MSHERTHDLREVSISAIPELLIRLDSAAREPLHRQVYQGIREAILSGQVAAGVRIPSSRRLAEHLAVYWSDLSGRYLPWS